MEAKEKIKEYRNGDLTVVWKPAKCIHSGICVQTLPEVYDPNAKPTKSKPRDYLRTSTKSTMYEMAVSPKEDLAATAG